MLNGESQIALRGKSLCEPITNLMHAAPAACAVHVQVTTRHVVHGMLMWHMKRWLNLNGKPYKGDIRAMASKLTLPLPILADPCVGVKHVPLASLLVSLLLGIMICCAMLCACQRPFARHCQHSSVNLTAALPCVRHTAFGHLNVNCELVLQGVTLYVLNTI